MPLLPSSISASVVSAAPRLSSLVSSPVVSGDVSLLGEIGPKSISQPMLLSRPESDVGLDVPPRLVSTLTHSGSITIAADVQEDTSSCVHNEKTMMQSSISASAHAPVQLILEGGELSSGALIKPANEQSSGTALEESVITADADSSTDTDTPDISVPAQHSTAIVKQEADEAITLSSSDGENAVGIPPISDVTALQRQVSELRRQRQRDLRQLVFWSNTVAKLGAEMDRPPTESESRARQKLISSGDWPSYMESVKTASFRKLGGRFADFYRGSLHSLFTD